MSPDLSRSNSSTFRSAMAAASERVRHPMKTIGSELALQRGVGPGFDYLRIALAVSIVAWHTEAILAPPPEHDQQQFIWMLGYAPLVAFRLPKA